MANRTPRRPQCLTGADCAVVKGGPISGISFAGSFGAQSPAEGYMTVDYGAARLNMVESQVRTNDVTDVAIHDAMRAVAREAFCPADKAFQAYADVDVEYAPGRWLLKPRDVGKLLQALKPRAGEKALAVAAPYAAAVLEHIGLDVTRVDADLAGAAGQYDLIIVEGAVSAVPAAWLQALAPEGRLGAIERNGPVGRARIHLRGSDDVGVVDAFDATPPVLAGFEAPAGFAF